METLEIPKARVLAVELVFQLKKNMNVWGTILMRLNAHTAAKDVLAFGLKGGDDLLMIPRALGIGQKPVG
jgi:hypothetical protein